MTNICSIMQPTYLPWAGYFNLIARADHFYFLDDVQFEKGSWQQRNQILLGSHPCLLTVPVNRSNLGQLINEVTIDTRRGNWRRKHIQSLSHAYSRKPYFNLIEPLLNIIENESMTSICNLNIALIQQISEIIGLNTSFHLSSSHKIHSSRSLKLLALCEITNSNVYLSPVGATDYLAEDSFESQSQVALQIQDYQCVPYMQNQGRDFVSHMSIVDVLVNLGKKGTYDYVTSEMTIC